MNKNKSLGTLGLFVPLYGSFTVGSTNFFVKEIRRSVRETKNNRRYFHYTTLLEYTNLDKSACVVVCQNKELTFFSPDGTFSMWLGRQTYINEGKGKAKAHLFICANKEVVIRKIHEEVYAA